jgi:hypothetical protein
MPRTFTLAGLMLGITLIATICGFAVRYPDVTLIYMLIVASLAPSAIVCLAVVSFSRRRKTVLTCSLFGALAGMSCGMPGQLLGPPMTTVWQAIGPVFMPLAISSTLGALLFGSLALVLDPLDSQTPPDAS